MYTSSVTERVNMFVIPMDEETKRECEEFRKLIAQTPQIYPHHKEAWARLEAEYQANIARSRVEPTLEPVISAGGDRYV